jgi:antitoxin component YwqK of YwqJK toxin-antitoxin module
MKHYHSSIPKEARERVTARRPDGTQKFKAEYLINGEVVGYRQFDETGLLEFERPMKNGVTHGRLYDFVNGSVTFVENYVDGLAHGTARQWSPDGELMGAYTMKHGSGLDLWRAKDNWGRGRVYLSEARYLSNGMWHGFEWWLNEDQRSVHSERHFQENLQHGIEREWNPRGRLRRGFPRYWIHGAKVARRRYILLSANDPTLPPYRESDNAPRRQFPAEIRRNCVLSKRRG